MRVFSCKLYCSFLCSSKSSLHLYLPCALKSEDIQHASSSPCPIPHGLEKRSPDEKVVVEKIDGSVHGKVETLLKSSLKKSAGSGPKEVGKREVKWMDMVGKELVEIKEFEPM